MPLNQLKQSFPLETAEFAISRGIDDEPTFLWWVPWNLSLRDKIIAIVNKRISIVRHKNDVDLPNEGAHIKKLDEINGSIMWMDAINSEMENLEDRDKIQVGLNKTSSHLVFDVRMDIERKSR